MMARLAFGVLFAAGYLWLVVDLLTVGRRSVAAAVAEPA